ncbi:adenosine receptor A3-like [Lineus longissimus]|uniref:adenosine receptor A3-like n=1 Tax=Lineus longissimus TaxID=88925 RepID=UPI00315CB62A
MENVHQNINGTEREKLLEQLLTVDLEDVVYGALLSILGLLIVSGNLLVIIAVNKNKTLRNKMYVLIVSLAIADLLTGLVHPLNAVTYFVKTLNQSKRLCLIIDFLGLVPLSASVLHLCAISVDRFIAINFSLHYEMIMTRRTIVVTLLISWGLSVIIGAIPGLGVNTWNAPLIPWCYWQDVITPEFLLFIGIVLILGSVLMVTLYTQIFIMAWKQHKKISVGKRIIDREKHKGWRRDMKAVKVIGVVIGVYLTCWLPSAIMMVRGYLQIDIPRYIRNIVFIFAIANSMMNPLIYAWGNKTMRKTFKRILHIPEKPQSEQEYTPRKNYSDLDNVRNGNVLNLEKVDDSSIS